MFKARERDWKGADMPRLGTLMAFGLLAATAAPAHAYLDGATASFALQAIIGFFAAWGLYSRRAMAKVKGLFGRKTDPQG